LIEDYPGAERDLALFLVQRRYYFYIKDFVAADKAISPLMKRKALAIAKIDTFKRLNEIPELADRAKLLMLEEANETGWFSDRDIGMEYSDFQDAFAEILDFEGDAKWDSQFIIQQLFPLARTIGISTQQLLTASIQTKKIRRIVAPSRDILKREKAGLISSETAHTMLTALIKQVADPKVTYSILDKNIQDLTGATIGRKEPIEGFEIMGPGGEWYLMIPITKDSDMAMIEQATMNRVKFTTTDYLWLVKKITGWLKIGGNNGHGADREQVSNSGVTGGERVSSLIGR